MLPIAFAFETEGRKVLWMEGIVRNECRINHMPETGLLLPGRGLGLFLHDDGDLVSGR